MYYIGTNKYIWIPVSKNLINFKWFYYWLCSYPARNTGRDKMRIGWIYLSFSLVNMLTLAFCIYNTTCTHFAWRLHYKTITFLLLSMIERNSLNYKENSIKTQISIHKKQTSYSFSIYCSILQRHYQNEIFFFNINKILVE